MNNKQFKEIVIFLELKDKPIMGSDKFRTYVNKKYKYSDDSIEMSQLRAKIINYQIDVYGSTMSDTIEKKTKEEKLKIYQRRNNRKYLRRHKNEG